MKCQTNQYKLQYFSQITETEYQCFVCLHKIIIALQSFFDKIYQKKPTRSIEKPNIVKELLFPGLFHFFIKLLQDEIKSTKNENITNSNVCSQFKRSKSQVQLQRHQNNIQMISHSHNIIALEDCSEEYNQSQLNNQAQDNVSKSNLCLEDKLQLETKNSDQLQY